MKDPCRFTILDKNGIEMPLHWPGRYRTKEEAERLCAYLNNGGKGRPYTIIDITEENAL